MITDIYRIRTENSIYEIHVKDGGQSRCRKDSSLNWRNVTADHDYLEKLMIGPSFHIPGVVTTSRVQDYRHYKLVPEHKRTIRESETTIPKFFEMVADHVKEQASPQEIVVERNVGQIDF